MKIRLLFLAAVSLLMLAGVNVFAQGDFKMRQKMTAAGRTSESAVMIKGARERTESTANGVTNVTIMQCDLKRTIQINDIEKKYVITPMMSDAAPVAPTTKTTVTKTKTTRGGIVTQTMEITDTGERKQMFGMTARHIKTVMTVEPSADACQKEASRVETDGWYVDLSVGMVCKFDRPVETTQWEDTPRGCVDQPKLIKKGTGKLGYALQVTTKIGMPGLDDMDAETKAMMAQMGMSGGMMSTTTEVTELSKAVLPADLFDIPAGYTEVKDMSELYGGRATQKAVSQYQKTPEAAAERNQMMQNIPSMAGRTGSAAPAKKPGTIRVGVMPVGNSSGRPVSTEIVRTMLSSQIRSDNVDAVVVSSIDEAKQAQCDYVLNAEVKSFKESAASKIGGMFGKVTGTGTGAPKLEATVGYNLNPVGGTGLAVQSQAVSPKAEGEDNSVMMAIGDIVKAVMKAVKK